jgi:hypothetical protein
MYYYNKNNNNEILLKHFLFATFKKRLIFAKYNYI